MDQTTDPAPARTDADPIDHDEIRRTVERGLRAQDGPPPRYEDLEEMEQLLRGHIQLLMPAATQAVERVWAGSPEGYNARRRLDIIPRHLDDGLGTGLVSARKHVGVLARHCLWLLARIPGGAAVTQYCVHCARPIDGDPVLVGTVPSASGPDRALYACVPHRA